MNPMGLACVLTTFIVVGCAGPWSSALTFDSVTCAASVHLAPPLHLGAAAGGVVGLVLAVPAMIVQPGLRNLFQVGQLVFLCGGAGGVAVLGHPRQAGVDCVVFHPDVGPGQPGFEQQPATWWWSDGSNASPSCDDVLPASSRALCRSDERQQRAFGVFAATALLGLAGWGARVRRRGRAVVRPES